MRLPYQLIAWEAWSSDITNKMFGLQYDTDVIVVHSFGERRRLLPRQSIFHNVKVAENPVVQQHRAPIM
ncbi:uncharacterized conserved protein [Paenibacillus popilliae ATCC 14706]|uniref:Uncharacterized conserved protein n=1 Tax=Paenibacillus popilliae ATCC 14706 TaxID=1212764 RepID=M9LHD2_PAEPP|nr:uncharacterized conserved protein [Paenibacillus popilliae ATCC 14706]